MGINTVFYFHFTLLISDNEISVSTTIKKNVSTLWLHNYSMRLFAAMVDTDNNRRHMKLRMKMRRAASSEGTLAPAKIDGVQIPESIDPSYQK